MCLTDALHCLSSPSAVDDASGTVRGAAPHQGRDSGPGRRDGPPPQPPPGEQQLRRDFRGGCSVSDRPQPPEAILRLLDRRPYFRRQSQHLEPPPPCVGGFQQRCPRWLGQKYFLVHHPPASFCSAAESARRRKARVAIQRRWRWFQPPSTRDSHPTVTARAVYTAPGVISTRILWRRSRQFARRDGAA